MLSLVSDRQAQDRPLAPTRFQPPSVIRNALIGQRRDHHRTDEKVPGG